MTTQTQHAKRLHWARPADYAWGTGAGLLTALLLWLLFGVTPTTATTPVVTSPTLGAEVVAGEPLVIEGSAAPDQRLIIQSNGETIGEVTAGADGSFRYEVTPTDPGEYSIVVKAVDETGQEVAASAPLAFTITGPALAEAPTAAPEGQQPQVTVPEGGLESAPGEPVTLEGTGAPGATITVMDETGEALGETTVDSTGAWTLTLPALEAGTYALGLTQTTAEGQESALAEPIALAVGGQATAIAVAPTAGAAPAAEATAPAVGAEATAAAGTPGVTAPAAEATSPAVGAEATAAAGTPGTTVPAAEATAPAAEATAPAVGAEATAAEAAPPAVTVPEAGEVQPAGEPVTLEGTGVPGATITVTDETGEELGQAVVDALGKWALILPLLELGDHALSLEQTTPEGEEVAPAEPLALRVDEAGAAVLPPAGAAPEITSPEVGVRQPADEPVTLEGTGAPGATVTVTDAAGEELGQTIVDTLGKWALTLPELEIGRYALDVTQTTPEGEETKLAERVALAVGAAGAALLPVVEATPTEIASPTGEAVTPGAGAAETPGAVTPAATGPVTPAPTVIGPAAEATPPAVTSPEAGEVPPTGEAVTPEGAGAEETPGAVTPAATGPATPEPTVTGPAAEAGQPAVTSPTAGAMQPAGQPVTLEGTGAPGATITVTDAAGVELGQAIVDTLGKWALTLPALDAGALELSVKQTTPEGEETTLPEPLPVTVVEAGQLAVSPPSAGEVQPAGEPVTLEGVGAPGATITVTDAAGVELGQAIVDALGRWVLTLPALEAGVYDLGVMQTTPEGEEVELAAPVAMTVGEVERPSITSPEVGETQPADEPVTLEGAGTPGATITVTDAAGQVLGKAIVDSAGRWALTLPALGIGSHALDVTQTTPAGEETTLAERVALTIGAAGAALAPAAEAVEGPAITSPAVGAVQPAGEPVTLEGTGAPGATITVMDAAGEVLGEALVDPAGKWSLALPALQEGPYDLRVTQTTAEGEETALAEPLALTLGIPGIVLPEVTKPGTDLNVVLNALLTLEGIGQPGATIEVLEGTTTLAEATVDPNGAWQAEIVGLSPGIHLLTLRQTTISGAEAEAMTPVRVAVIGEEVPPMLVTEAPALVGEGPVIVQPGETILGIAPAGAVVEVYAGTRLLGRAETDREGNWQFRLPISLPRTTRELTIKALGATGALLSEADTAILIGPPTTLPTTGGCLRRPVSGKWKDKQMEGSAAQ